MFEDLDVFVAPSLRQVRYIEFVNSAGQTRDSIKCGWRRGRFRST